MSTVNKKNERGRVIKGAGDMERRYITSEQAQALLPNTQSVHTFYNMPFGLFGADWSKEDVIDKLNNADKIEITGECARGMGHGLAVYNNDTKRQSEVLFIETNKEKLDKFDPIQEQKQGGKRMTLDEAIEHTEEVMVENLEKTKGRNAIDPIAINCFECAEEHRQLAEWLRELKAHREARKKIKAEIENKALDSTKYVACGLYEAMDIINKHIGEQE